MSSRPSSRRGSRTPSSSSAAKPDRQRPSLPTKPTPERRSSASSMRTADRSGSARRESSGSGMGRGRNSTSENKTSATGHRRLSFVECTLGQVEEAMRGVNPKSDLHMDYWSVILTDNPSDSFRILQNRTLSFWVKFFNKWIKVRKSANDDFVDGEELQKMLCLSDGNFKKICSMFDPEGGRRLSTTGLTTANLHRVKISATSLMVAGVMLSRMISSRHKLSFLFGLFDNDDSRTLDKQQFAKFVHGFKSALGIVFAIPDEWMPTDEEIKAVVNGLYTRISQYASKKIRGIHAGADEATRKAIINVIRVRSQGGAKAREVAASKSIGTAQQAIPYNVLRDWCHGEQSQSDPLALPYLLTIERFCPQRLGDVADEFDDRLSEFQLSHSEPVEVPKEDEPVLTKHLLSRPEVLFTRFVLEFCKKNDRWKLNLSDLDSCSQLCEIDVSNDFKTNLGVGLALCVAERERAKGVLRLELLDLLRKICPEALPKHLRMFDVWCQEYDALLEACKAITNLEDADRTFAEVDARPELPPRALAILEEQFEDMDRQGRGYISLADIMDAWQWSEQLASETMIGFDVNSDGYLDKKEFMRMMCPPEYRLPDMSGLGREAFGRLLKRAIEDQKKSQSQQFRRFSNIAPTSDDDHIKPMPRSLLPEVGEEMWAQWVSLYNSLDKDADGNVNLPDMIESGLLSSSVCETILQLIDPKDHHSFTREGFLQAMARTFDCRIPPEKLQAA